METTRISRRTKTCQSTPGDLGMSQEEYVKKISPLQIPKHRRVEPAAAVADEEKQSLRQICGSLQYAAVNTRPDLAAKVGEIQSSIGSATVGHLAVANRVLAEAKKNRVCLMIVPIHTKEVTFCGFSDASFASCHNNSSRRGLLIFATGSRLLKNQTAVISPVAWSSRKIPRVIRSTLSAEAVALSGALDRLSWIRIMWEWLKDPSVNIASPEEVLKRSPTAAIATDCKSLYDITTRTAPPACEETRTTLECLLIRERLAENCRLRWVNSQATLADCLTKIMDCSVLRQHLLSGMYALFDETATLQERADKRARFDWVKKT